MQPRCSSIRVGWFAREDVRGHAWYKRAFLCLVFEYLHLRSEEPERHAESDSEYRKQVGKIQIFRVVVSINWNVISPTRECRARSHRVEQVLEETASHLVKALNSPVPVQVQEALRGDLSGQLISAPRPCHEINGPLGPSFAEMYGPPCNNRSPLQ